LQLDVWPNPLGEHIYGALPKYVLRVLRRFVLVYPTFVGLALCTKDTDLISRSELLACEADATTISDKADVSTAIE